METIPENLTFEQFKALADRQPSFEGSWVYRLTHSTLWGDYEYPEFRIHNIGYLFLSLEEAKKYMEERLVPETERYETYRFLIEQVPIGDAENLIGAAWVYDKDGSLVETSTTISYGKFPESSFFGRSRERIRFHEGDIVEVVDGDNVHLAIVGDEGPTVKWFWDLYRRSMLERNKFGKSYYSAGFSDDCYYVIDAPGCHAHQHVTTLMAPSLPIPQDIREYFEECLALSKQSEDHYDSRIIIMESTAIFDTAQIDMTLHYDSDRKRHRLSLRTIDNINDTESERELPLDLSKEELQKISEWLRFKKYGKSRLWYLIREWNEFYSSDTIPALSPDTPLEEMLTI